MDLGYTSQGRMDEIENIFINITPVVSCRTEVHQEELIVAKIERHLLAELVREYWILVILVARISCPGIEGKKYVVLFDSLSTLAWYEFKSRPVDRAELESLLSSFEEIWSRKPLVLKRFQFIVLV